MKPLLATLAMLVVVGCATPEGNPAKTEAHTQTSKKCDDVPTGSHLKRCDRGGTVSMSREELERMQANSPGGSPQTRQ